MFRELFNAQWKSLSAGAALIVVLTVATYLPALHAGFVFDDEIYLTNNQMIKDSDGLHRFWLTSEAPDYYPLTWSLWWLEWRLWGATATGYHVVNVILHAVNAVLVWMILRRLKVPGAWVAAAVFAIHPVNVATVAWVSEQKNTLSMLFFALSILCYLRFDDEVSAGASCRDVGRDAVHRVHGRAGAQPYQRLPWIWYALSLVAAQLALLSKSATVMLPVVLLGCVWWRHRQVRRQDWLRSAPFFVLSLVSGLATIWFQYHRVMRGHAILTGGFPGRLAMAGRAPWFYLSKALLPIDLTVIYPKWEIDPTRLMSYVPGVVWLGLFLVFWWKRQSWGRPLLFGLGYFVVMLTPVLGFFDQAFYQFSLVADHWQYYSIVGLIALVVAAAQEIGGRMNGWGRRAHVFASVAVLIVLGVASWSRSSVYVSEETLWRDNVAKNPDAWVARNNLGHALEQTGRLDDAIEQFAQAVKLNPHYAQAHSNLGNTLRRTGKLPEAIRHLEQAVRLKPDYAEAYLYLGLAWSEVGKIQEAIKAYEQALRIQPDYAEAHNNLAVALQREGRLPESIDHYQQALRLRPDSADAHNKLGNAFLQAGKPKDAVAQYEVALRIMPDLTETQNNLAWLLATLGPTEGGDAVRAVTLAERMCKLGGKKDPSQLDTLSVAYASAGRFDDAIATSQKAIALARGAGQAELAKEIGTRLQLYREGHPYRQPVTAKDLHNPS